MSTKPVMLFRAACLCEIWIVGLSVMVIVETCVCSATGLDTCNYTLSNSIVMQRDITINQVHYSLSPTGPTDD